MEDFDIEKYKNKLIPFYSDGKLNKWPGKYHLRMLALIEIVKAFDKEASYNEKEVNEIIKSKISFNDIENIRRELIDYHFLERLRDGSKYWVNVEWENKYHSYL